MITEDYVSFETAKLLKEKGFSCNVSRVWFDYTESNEWNRISFDSSCDKFDEDKMLKCPTLQMAMKWLREVHNKHCDTGYDIDLKWFFQIIDLKETTEYDYPETKYYHSENETGFNSYEEACEAAIKYCLENLI